MKESYWGYGIIILGLFIIGVMLLVNGTTTNSTQDYYTLKEVTQASMIDAVDFAYYRLYGNVKMSERKFVESFLRRFAENSSLSNTYNVEFYDLYEVPPKVSVKVSTTSGSYNVANSQTSFDVTSTIDAILEWEGNTKKCQGDDCDMTCPLYICPKLVEDIKNDRFNISTPGVNFEGMWYSLSDEERRICSSSSNDVLNENGTQAINWRNCEYLTKKIESAMGDITHESLEQLRGTYPWMKEMFDNKYLAVDEASCY